MTALPRRAHHALEPHVSDPCLYDSEPAGATGASGNGGLDLFVAQLLCARLCHDLMSPAGAVDIGLGLFSGSDGGDADALRLAADGAREVVSRLKLFRLVFGAGGTAAGSSAAEAERLLSRLVAGRRVHLHWRPAAQESDTASDAAAIDALRLAVCLILSAADALPRGGEIDVSGDAGTTTGLRLVVRGTPLRLRDDIVDALTTPDPERLSARNVHAYYARRLAARLGLSLRFARSAEDALTIATARAPTPAVQWLGFARPALGEHTSHPAERLPA